VNQRARTTSDFASVGPRGAEIFDGLAVSMEDEPADRSVLFQPFMLGKLSFENLLDLCRERERPTLALLASSGS
jgi:hypothetical protein